MTRLSSKYKGVPKSLIPTSEGVNPLPICLLCGVNIPEPEHYGIANSSKPEVLRKGRWKNYWKCTPKHVMVPSIQLEEAYLSECPRLGSCFCRAIIKESESSYRLTGITMIKDGWLNGPLHIPNDPAMARIGGKKNARYDSCRFSTFYAASIGRKSHQLHRKKIGYIVHAYCWVLFEWVLGTNLTKRNLTKFIRTSRKYWRKNESWELSDDDIYLVEPTQFLPTLEWGCDIYQNPLIIPAVQKAIEVAKVEAEHSKFYFRNFSFPLEISLLISECVCPINHTENDIKDIKNLLLTFQWQLPDFFWRLRLNEDLFIELGELKKTKSSVDWQVLRLGLMSLVANRKWYVSSGLGNRERVLGIMVEIKKGYLERS